jgi:anti-sigma regulatory factor (Ser/Thr protein kinase)
MQGTFDLTLPPEPGSVAEARMKVCHAIEEHLVGGEAETVKLLVSELVTNAVKYGDGKHPVELRAHWNAEVRIEVSDHNGGFTPGPRIGGLDEPGGFGLFLVGQLADRWGVESDEGTTVWFVLRRH